MFSRRRLVIDGWRRFKADALQAAMVELKLAVSSLQPDGLMSWLRQGARPTSCKAGTTLEVHLLPGMSGKDQGVTKHCPRARTYPKVGRGSRSRRETWDGACLGSARLTGQVIHRGSFALWWLPVKV